MSENTENKENTTLFSFWSFLKKYKIEIPIIQRDYAQGRVGKEYLRKNFLENLINALEDSRKGNKLILDFVYGSEKGEKKEKRTYLLDGQQRLTTLWLLHWYIAYKANMLNEKVEECDDKTVKDILKKFSYETRISSRNFCEKLSKFEASEKDCDIKKHIQNQTWFYSAWNQDPTIQSMLRMLNGTEINDKNGNDIVDGIEEFFKKTDQSKYEEYWNNLTGDSPIVFYYMPLENFGLSDDLYVKMNARGKALTDFENFKADLIGYIREQYEIAKENKSKDQDSWKELLNEKGIPTKLDTDWTDIFWDNRSNDNKIDDIYFAFMNRFFLNYKIKDLIKNEEESYYKYFTGAKKGEEDIDIKYNSLNNYKWNGEIEIELFDDLKTILDNYHKFYEEIKKEIKELSTEEEQRKKIKEEIEDIFRCAWDNSFEFIPIYYKPVKTKKEETEEKEIVSTLSQVQRIVFFAICKYFKEFKVNENEIIDNKKQLKSWMCVVWNLVSGKNPINKSGDSLPQIRTVDAMKNAIKDIDKLDSHKVYESLLKLHELNYKLQYSNESFMQRWNEEIEKAKKIFNEKDGSLFKYDGSLLKEDGSEYETWEDVIIEAEEYAFFNGAIRFLYQNEKGGVSWNNFDNKFKEAKRYFKAKEENNDSCLKSDFNNSELLKALISRFEKKDVIEKTDFRVFNNKASTWRYYLLNNALYSPVHQLMSGEIDIKDNKDDTIFLLTNTGLLDFVMKRMPLARLREYNNRYVIHQEYKDCVCLDAQNRDKFFNDKDNVEKIKINSYHNKIDNCNLLFGINIHFNYKYENKEMYFVWWCNDFIYLKYDPKPKDTCIIKDDNAKTEEERFYCFSIKDLKDNEIIENLDKLIREYEKYMKNKE